MIYGTGDIANILQDRNGALFFAAGVSNSACNSKFEFDRERKILSQHIQIANQSKLCLFYFGSLSIFLKKSPYVIHKLNMEKLIKTECENYCIVRIGNITWGDNPNTFINYFRRMIAQNKPYKVVDEYRYLISKEEILLLTNNLPLTGRNEINVTGQIVKVQDVVNSLLNGKKSVHKV